MIGDVRRTGLAIVAGFLTLFVLIRIFEFHTHEVAVEPEEAGPPGAGDHHGHAHGHVHRHGDAHGDAHGPSGGAAKLSRFAWLGMFTGLAIHSLIDGVALGAAIASADSRLAWIGPLGTFLAIAAHKPLDALSIRSVMIAGGTSANLQLTVNLVFAVLCPIAAFLFLMGQSAVPLGGSVWTGYALGFSAGVFLCIALSDVLPELEFHSHDRVTLTAALFGGIAVAWAIEVFAHGL
jgi:zinc and cadmium transporter